MEKITHAAVRFENGTILKGRNHGSIMYDNSFNGGPRIEDDMMGFYTSSDRFVTRREAAEIAFKAGQINKECGALQSYMIDNIGNM
jgi:hypothetical protein